MYRVIAMVLLLPLIGCTSGSNMRSSSEGPLLQEGHAKFNIDLDREDGYTIEATQFAIGGNSSLFIENIEGRPTGKYVMNGVEVNLSDRQINSATQRILNLISGHRAAVSGSELVEIAIQLSGPDYILSISITEYAGLGIERWISQ